MTDPALSAALKEAYASAPVDEVVLHTLEIRHPAISPPIRVVRDGRDLEARLEATAPVDPGAVVTFVGMRFDFALANIDTSPVPEVVMSLSAVTREVLDGLRAAVQSADPVEVTYRPFLSSAPLDGPEMDPPLTMTIGSVTATAVGIEARARVGDIGQRAWPRRLYTLDAFPALAT